MKTQMSVRTRAILINVSIAVGLAFEYLKGKRIIAIAISGIMLFAIANMVIVISARRKSATHT
jgi:hypothetical protein